MFIWIPAWTLNVFYESYSSDDTHHCANNLSIVHINIQSLLPSIVILEAEMQQYDILVFTESWLPTHISNEDIKLTNFSPPYRTDRNDRQGGGVAIYVKEVLQPWHRPGLISGK